MRVTRATTQHEPKLGRSPTPQEMADHLELDLEMVMEAIMAGRAYQTYRSPRGQLGWAT